MFNLGSQIYPNNKIRDLRSESKLFALKHWRIAWTKISLDDLAIAYKARKCQKIIGKLQTAKSMSRINKFSSIIVQITLRLIWSSRLNLHKYEDETNWSLQWRFVPINSSTLMTWRAWCLVIVFCVETWDLNDTVVSWLVHTILGYSIICVVW